MTDGAVSGMECSGETFSWDLPTELTQPPPSATKVRCIQVSNEGAAVASVPVMNPSPDTFLSVRLTDGVDSAAGVGGSCDGTTVAGFDTDTLAPVTSGGEPSCAEVIVDRDGDGDTSDMGDQQVAIGLAPPPSPVRVLLTDGSSALAGDGCEDVTKSFELPAATGEMPSTVTCVQVNVQPSTVVSVPVGAPELPDAFVSVRITDGADSLPNDPGGACGGDVVAAFDTVSLTPQVGAGEPRCAEVLVQLNDDEDTTDPGEQAIAVGIPPFPINVHLTDGSSPLPGTACADVTQSFDLPSATGTLPMSVTCIQVDVDGVGSVSVPTAIPNAPNAFVSVRVTDGADSAPGDPGGTCAGDAVASFDSESRTPFADPGQPACAEIRVDLNDDGDMTDPGEQALAMGVPAPPVAVRLTDGSSDLPGSGCSGVTESFELPGATGSMPMPLSCVEISVPGAGALSVPVGVPDAPAAFVSVRITDGADSLPGEPGGTCAGAVVASFDTDSKAPAVNPGQPRCAQVIIQLNDDGDTSDPGEQAIAVGVPPAPVAVRLTDGSSDLPGDGCEDVTESFVLPAGTGTLPSAVTCIDVDVQGAGALSVPVGIPGAPDAFVSVRITDGADSAPGDPGGTCGGAVIAGFDTLSQTPTVDPGEPGCAEILIDLDGDGDLSDPGDRLLAIGVPPPAVPVAVHLTDGMSALPGDGCTGATKSFDLPSGTGTMPSPITCVQVDVAGVGSVSVPVRAPGVDDPRVMVRLTDGSDSMPAELGGQCGGTAIVAFDSDPLTPVLVPVAVPTCAEVLIDLDHDGDTTDPGDQSLAVGASIPAPPITVHVTDGSTPAPGSGCTGGTASWDLPMEATRPPPSVGSVSCIEVRAGETGLVSVPVDGPDAGSVVRVRLTDGADSMPMDLGGACGGVEILSLDTRSLTPSSDGVSAPRCVELLVDLNDDGDTSDPGEQAIAVGAPSLVPEADGFVATFRLPDAVPADPAPFIVVGDGFAVEVDPQVLVGDAYVDYNGHLTLLIQLNCAVLTVVLQNVAPCQDDLQTLHDEVLPERTGDGYRFEVSRAEILDAFANDRLPPCGGSCPLVGVNLFVRDAADARYSSFSLQTNALVAADAAALADALEDDAFAPADKGGPFTPVVLVDQPGVGVGPPDVLSLLPFPQINSVTPSNGPIVGGTLVTILGSGFLEGATVLFGETEAAVEPGATANRLVVVAPAGAAATADFAVDVTVTNPDPIGIPFFRATKEDGYTYNVQPTIEAVSPPAGTEFGGLAVTVSGTGFQEGAQLSFDGIDVATTFASPWELRATTPPHPLGAVDVRVVNPDGFFDTLADGFVYDVPPTIGTVTPSIGSTAGGTPVTITGTNFANGAIVRFGLQEGVTTFISPTELRVVTPARTGGPANVHVVNPSGISVTKSSGFVFVNPPAITGVSPQAGSTLGGTVVTLTGLRFASGATVRFGETAVPATVLSATQARATSPAHAPGTVSITLTNPTGVAGSIADAFTYAPPPVLTAVSPAVGLAGGGTVVTLTGTDFVNGLAVRFGTVPAVIDSIAATAVVVRAPAHAVGTVPVSVTNPDGQTAAKADAFTFDHVPTISLVSPGVGPQAGGTTVTLVGTGFGPGASVAFDGVAATGVTVAGPTQISAVSPPHAAGAVAIRVQNNPSGFAADLPNAFTYQGSAPTVSGVTPATGTTNGGTEVEIAGQNFRPGATVLFGSLVASSPQVVSQTLLRVVSPARSTAGAVAVHVRNADETEASLPHGFTYTAAPAPVIGSIAPASGPRAGGTSVTVTGTGFVSASVLFFDGSLAGNVAVNAAGTEITGTTPSHSAGAVTVAVVNPDGQTAGRASGFLYSGPAAPTPSPTTGASTPASSSSASASASTSASPTSASAPASTGPASSSVPTSGAAPTSTAGPLQPPAPLPPDASLQQVRAAYFPVAGALHGTLPPPNTVVPFVLPSVGARPTEEGVEVTWSAPRALAASELGGFYVFRSSSPFSLLATINDPEQRSFTDDTTQEDGFYRYVVTFFTKAGQGVQEALALQDASDELILPGATVGERATAQEAEGAGSSILTPLVLGTVFALVVVAILVALLLVGRTRSAPPAVQRGRVVAGPPAEPSGPPTERP